MKSKKNLLEQLNTLPHFEKSSVYQLGKQLGLQDSTVDTYISRFLKYKDIYRLKNGFYVSGRFLENNKQDISYSFYLANVLRTPSYISSWTALQYYGLATEAIHTIASVTLKVTRNYRTKAGSFTYQSIDKKFFSDFSLVSGRFDFFIASPAKALFDLLYFRTRQFRGFSTGSPAPNPKKIREIIEGLRIDIDEMDGAEQEKFNAMVKRYL